MAELVNLNKAKKARDQAERRAKADENAVKFGRSRAEKETERARAAKARALLDAHKRDGE